MPRIGDIELPDFPLLLAPMEDVSDPPFRTLCKEQGADVMYTEFISSEGLIRDAAKSVINLDIYEKELPVGIQIFGCSRVNHRSGGLIIIYGSRITGGLKTGRLDTVPALVWKKQPFELPADDRLVHPDQLVGIKGEIGRILVSPTVGRFFCGKIMPRLAGDLAAPAGRT